MSYGLSPFISHISMPNFMVEIASKIVKDIRSLPAARDLFALMSAKVLGGNAKGESPIWKSAKILNSASLFGFPL